MGKTKNLLFSKSKKDLLFWILKGFPILNFKKEVRYSEYWKGIAIPKPDTMFSISNFKRGLLFWTVFTSIGTTELFNILKVMIATNLEKYTVGCCRDKRSIEKKVGGLHLHSYAQVLDSFLWVVPDM